MKSRKLKSNLFCLFCYFKQHSRSKVDANQFYENDLSTLINQLFGSAYYKTVLCIFLFCGNK